MEDLELKKRFNDKYFSVNGQHRMTQYISDLTGKLQKTNSEICPEGNKAWPLPIVLFFFCVLWILRNGDTHNEDNEILYQMWNDSYKK
jgi:hypothetical protein